jgi:hypothetical protein
MKKGHYITDNDIIDRFISNIGINGVGIYSVLKRYMNTKTRECFPSQDFLAKKCGCDKRTILRGIKSLEANGLIDVVRKPRKPNIYYLNHVSRFGINVGSKNGITMLCSVCGLRAVKRHDSMICPKCLMDVGLYVESVLEMYYPDILKEDIYGTNRGSKVEKSMWPIPDSYYESISINRDIFPKCEPYTTRDIICSF